MKKENIAQYEINVPLKEKLYDLLMQWCEKEGMKWL